MVLSFSHRFRYTALTRVNTIQDSLRVEPAPAAPNPSIFDRFFRRLRGNRERAFRELKTLQQELIDLVSPLLAANESRQDGNKMQELYLHAPLKSMERSVMQKRLFLTLDNFARSQRESARLLPETWEGDFNQLASLLRGKNSRWSRSKEFALRDHVLFALSEASRKQIGLEERLLNFHIVGLETIRDQWRYRALNRPLSELTDNWSRAVREGRSALQDWHSLISQQEQQLPNQVLTRVSKRPRKSRLIDEEAKGQRSLSFQSLETEFQLLTQVEECRASVRSGLENLRDSLDQERGAIVRETTELAEWLTERLADEMLVETHPPAGTIKVATAGERILEFDAVLRNSQRTIPQTVAYLSELRIKHGKKERWKQLAPEAAFKEAWGLARPTLDQRLKKRVSEHQELLAGCDRARDVIHFGLNLDVEGGELLAREALENALALLNHQLEELSEPSSPLLVSEDFVKKLFDSLLCRLDRKRGLAALYVAKQRLTYESRLLKKGSGEALGELGNRLGSQSKERSRRFLHSIGFSKSEPTVSTIDVRNYLPQEYVSRGDRDIPAVYRRLFRIEPVEDPRFLVGRTQEIDSIVSALGLWHSGRAVSIILTGQRGSGKTSLLNCVNKYLANYPVTRGEFSKRLETASHMDDFLREHLELSSGDVIQQLKEGPSRIVVLEEMERTFLRKVGGFGALRRLQAIIGATCKRILWLLAMNEVCYGFLCQAVDLAQGFTHRIRTAVASTEDLRNAILIRHNLSGLRLRFEPPGQSKSRWRNAGRRLLGENDPEAEFFERLSQQSMGVYRTALEVWLGHIESCREGVLQLRSLQTPQLDGVVAELDGDDLFTLVAILQHGSLTVDEHSEVFSKSLSRSRTQLEELIGRELIEPDPLHQGLRVRPEAMPVVKEALYRRNLLS